MQSGMAGNKCSNLGNRRTNYQMTCLLARAMTTFFSVFLKQIAVPEAGVEKNLPVSEGE